jgi:hydrogenase-4 component B
MAHHRDRDNARAGYVYLVMASFGTLALLLAFGLLAGADGGYTFARSARRVCTRRLAALVLALVLLGAGSKAGSCRCTSGCRSPIRPRRATSRR